MGASDSNIDFLQFLDVLRTSVSDKTGRILAQLGSVVGRTVDGVNAEWWQHVGFTSRPSKPVAGKSSARAVVLRRGNVDAIIASEDDRGLELLGNLDDGETCVYAAGPERTAQGRVLIKKDGSVNLYTTHTNDKDGRSVYLRVAPDGFSFVAPWGTLKFDATGLHILHASGAAIDLGGIGGLPAPIDQLSSYIKMRAGTISQQAAMQTNGVGGGAALASAPAVLEAIAALQTEIAAIAASVTAIGALAPLSGAGGPAAAAPAAAAVVVTTTAMPVLTAAIPTTTTSS